MQGCNASASPSFAVEATVLYGFGNMSGGDGFAMIQIRNGAGEFYDAIVCPGGETEFLHGYF